MTKSLMIVPEQARAKGVLELSPIPLNQYDRTVRRRTGPLQPAQLLQVYRDMQIIRIFETMLSEVKLQGKWKGIEYNHRGPAHLSIGQEAAAVGQALPLSGRRPHLRQPPQPRRGPGQGVVGHRQARRGPAAGHHARLLRRRLPAGRGRRVARLGAGTWPSSTWSTAPWRRSSAGRPGSTRASAARCTSSSRRSGSTRTTRSWAARGTSRWGRPCTSTSTARPASSSATSATPRPACGPVWEGLCFATMDQFKDAVGSAAPRRPAADHELREQLLRHGRPAGGRDHGAARPGPDRRRAEPGADARRARRRLQSAGGRRRDRPEARRHRSAGTARSCSTP